MSNVGFKPELEKKAKQEQRVVLNQLRALFIGVFKQFFVLCNLALMLHLIALYTGLL